MLRHHADNDQLLKISEQKGVFGRMRGEVISVIHCKEVTVQPDEMIDKCFRELPVTYKSRTYYLEAMTRRLKKYGTEQPCDTVAASQFKTNEGSWITMTPKLHTIPSPKKTKLTTANLTRHIDMSHGGIFTHQQLQQWELSSSFPDYHQALGRKLTTRACAEEGCVLSHVDMNGEVRGIMKNALDELHIWDRIVSCLQTIGQVTSVLVATVWIGQIIIRIILCSLVCKTDGMEPAYGLCKLFFTKDQLLVKEYHAMKRKKKDEDEDEIIPMRTREEEE